MLHRSVGVYQATRCHSPEGSWLHGQHFTSDSFLLLQDTSQGHCYHTRMKCQMLIASDLTLWKGGVKVASTSEVRKTAMLRLWNL
jgi:hypothetical protein